MRRLILPALLALRFLVAGCSTADNANTARNTNAANANTANAARSFGTSGASTPPTTQSVSNAIQLTPYDQADRDTTSDGFRNRLEGGSSDTAPPIYTTGFTSG